LRASSSKQRSWPDALGALRAIRPCHLFSPVGSRAVRTVVDAHMSMHDTVSIRGGSRGNTRPIRVRDFRYPF
jgi:hypothetical protein